MAVEDWRKPVPEMRQEAISAVAELASGRQQACAPLRETAALIVVTAHQIPELVEAGEFHQGNLDDDALRDMAVVVDVASAWDDEEESLEDFVGGLDEEDLKRLAAASIPWARGVWETMVPLSDDEKQRTLLALRS